MLRPALSLALLLALAACDNSSSPPPAPPTPRQTAPSQPPAEHATDESDTTTDAPPEEPGLIDTPPAPTAADEPSADEPPAAADDPPTQPAAPVTTPPARPRMVNVPMPAGADRIILNDGDPALWGRLPETLWPDVLLALPLSVTLVEPGLYTISPENQPGEPVTLGELLNDADSRPLDHRGHIAVCKAILNRFNEVGVHGLIVQPVDPTTPGAGYQVRIALINELVVEPLAPGNPAAEALAQQHREALLRACPLQKGDVLLRSAIQDFTIAQSVALNASVDAAIDRNGDGIRLILRIGPR